MEIKTDEQVIVRENWPQPAVVPEPQIHANDRSLNLCYLTSEDKTVVVQFPLCIYMMFGAPNDEALGGHPLWSRGLKFYAVHEVLNSSLIKMLEERNSFHDRHDQKSYLENKKHYIFTFHDSTLECVVDEGKRWTPTISVIDHEEEAKKTWLKVISHA